MYYGQENTSKQSHKHPPSNDIPERKNPKHKSSPQVGLQTSYLVGLKEGANTYIYGSYSSPIQPIYSSEISAENEEEEG